MGVFDIIVCLFSIFFGGCEVEDWVDMVNSPWPSSPPFVSPPPQWPQPPFFQQPVTEFYTVGVLDDSTGFTVDGTHYEVVDATFYINGAVGRLADLDVGHLVRVQGELQDGRRVAAEVHYDATVIGRVVYTDENWFVVLDQRVVVDEFTVIERPVDVGLDVEVSGFIGPNGEIVASRVMVVEENTEPYLVGRVDQVDLSRWTFEVNGLDVDYGDAWVDLPFGIPKDGELVIVDGSHLSDGTLVAERLASFPATELTLSGTEVEIVGFVNRYVSPTSFEVGGYRVTSTYSTLFTNGTSSDLYEGVRVVVKGAVDEFDRVTAGRIRLQGTGSPGHLVVTVEDFSHLAIDGGWELTVVEGQEPRVALYYGEDVSNVLDLDRQGDLLAIGFRKDVLLQIGPTRLTGEITTTGLRELTLTGGSRVTMTGLTGEVLDVYLDGGSRTVCDDCDYRVMHAELHGGSRLVADRSAPLEEAVLNLDGASRVTVNMEIGARLAGSASGNSLIRYYGQDISNTVETASGGSVVHLGPTR